MDQYKKVVSTKLKFKGAVLPVKDKASKKKRDKKRKHTSKAEELVIKPEEEKGYLPVAEPEDTRTAAEKQIDERLKQKEKEFIKKRATMSYQEIIDEMNAKLEKQTDHNEMPRIAAAGLG